MRRFDMRLPAIVRVDGTNEFHTETLNVSARGVFFYLDRPVVAGTKAEVTLTFPPHVTLTDAVRVRVAAMIEDYEFLRTAGSTDFLSALQTGLKSAN